MDMGKSLCEAFHDYEEKMFELDKKNAVFEQIATRLKLQVAQKNGEKLEDEKFSSEKFSSENGDLKNETQDSLSKYARSNSKSQNSNYTVSIPGFKSTSSGSIGRCLSILGDNLN